MTGGGYNYVQVCPTDPQVPSAITLAEKSGQVLQTELLRLNEFTGNGGSGREAGQQSHLCVAHALLVC